MPDDTQNPLGGAQALENRFEAAWQAGAFDSQNPKEAEQLRAERAEQSKVEPPEQATSTPTTPASPEQKEVEAAPEYVNLDDYLQKAGLERDSFLTLPVRVGEADLPLADVLKRAEAHQDYSTQSNALAERQKAWDAEQAQQKSLWDQRLKAAETLGNLAYQDLVREYQSINWDQLSQQDPGRWAVLNTQFQQRVANIQAALQQIEGQHQEAVKQQQAQFQQNLTTEREKLFKVIPEWRDKDKFNAARDRMTGYAKDLGFSDQEVASISDHRYLRVLHEASQWRQLQAQSVKALKQVRAAPQISNPGARVQRDPNVTAYTQAKDAFMKTRGRHQDQSVQVAAFDQLAKHLS